MAPSNFKINESIKVAEIENNCDSSVLEIAMYRAMLYCSSALTFIERNHFFLLLLRSKNDLWRPHCAPFRISKNGET
uniref:Uncharacterized protein n=1 Tax=Trichogramma kaykai TaxID=54128 RepID=A0ABD2WDU8_9HYME